MDTEPEIQKADPVARRNALIAVIAISIPGALLIRWIDGRQEQHAGALENALPGIADHPELALAVCVGAILPLVAPLGYLFYQGRRIVDAQRQPYPGQRVTRDTPVLKGEKAIQRGRLLQSFAVFTAVLAIAGAVTVWWALLEISLEMAAS